MTLAHKTVSTLKSALLGTALVLGTAATVSVMTAAPAMAQDPAAEGRQFGAKAGELVNTANELLRENQAAAAISSLNQALAIPDINSYERSIINQMLGASYYEQNQYSEAIRYFEAAISAGGLLPNELSALRVNIAQLLIANGSYAQGAQMLENYINRGGEVKPAYVEMLTQAWVQSDNYSKALPWAERWFNSASPKERKHFDLLNFLYNNLRMPGKQADIVRQMINRWPEDKTLWDAWASMLANGGREQEAFEVSKMLYLGGALNTEADLMKVVQYYSFYDMPFQAAQILERELNSGKISQSPEKLVQLSDLYRQAREYKKAIPILERAASQSGQAKLYADLGEALYNEGDCTKAEDAFNNAISRGYDAGKSYMLIGTCRYENAQKLDRAVCKGTTKAQRQGSEKNKRREAAIEAFDRVPASSREGSNAKKWISFIRAEAEAVERRCEFEASVEQELCYVKIKQAYDAQIFTGTFDLDDEACERFIEKYDSIYRVKVADSSEN
ncbi:tetratricopeptide repeat protein [Fretibacter rubidus]|uniref:tetratricopeptide repeat protein n=1 Tax=Fretibacter rubidus TaxID=570162 RepID=UPI00352A076C